MVLARRLVPGWNGAPFGLAALVAGLASLVIVTIVTGLPGLFSAWTVALVLAGGALIVARFVPSPATLPDVETGPGRAPPGLLAVVASIPVLLAVVAALSGAWDRVGTGMTGFDSTWYHGPIAAELVRTGESFSLHFTAPQFMTWFYPHGSELLHAVAGSAWGGDLPSLGLNLLFLAGCLVAARVLARPWGGAAGPVSVAGVAAVLGCSVAFADQFGEARNDLAGTFFLLAGVALLANRRDPGSGRVGPAVLIGLAAGLAAGTKLNFVPPALVLLLGPALLAGRDDRIRAFLAALAGALATGGFWYLRNLIQSGNPLPWTAGDSALGVTLPGPIQETGGRDPGSVLGYAFDGQVLSDWFLPGLSEGFGPLWPVPVVLTIGAVAFAVFRPPAPAIRVGGLVAAAVALAWLIGPTSASGPEGEPLGFVSGLRYLVPGLAIGLGLLGPLVAGRSPRLAWTALGLLVALSITGFLELITWGRAEVVLLALGAAVLLGWTLLYLAPGGRPLPRRALFATAGAGVLVLLGAGYGIAARYDRDRYAAPAFTVPGLDRAFAWARETGPGPIATTATRSYPFRGAGLDRRVEFPGIRTGSGGLIPAGDCRSFREAVNEGRYRYLVLSLDREGRVRRYPRELRWIAGDPAARLVFREAPTAVFELEGRLDPSGCR